jgi:hypothetical protein
MAIYLMGEILDKHGYQFNAGHAESEQKYPHLRQAQEAAS